MRRRTGKVTKSITPEESVSMGNRILDLSKRGGDFQDTVRFLGREGINPYDGTYLCPVCHKKRRARTIKKRDSDKIVASVVLSCGHKYHFKKRFREQGNQATARRVKVEQAASHFFKDHGLHVRLEE